MLEGPVTVSELTARIKQQLEQGFSHIKVIGEVSRLVRHGSGHLYFTIKDAGASLSAVVWRSTLERMMLQPEEGQEYIFSGHISLYEPRGSYQLIVRRIEPSGSGALAAEFERKKQEFAKRGWFDAERKQPIPELPCHIGIVTSETAAALQDINKVLATRPGWLRRTLSPTEVQGAAAAKGIARAIQKLQTLDNRPDVILVARGGGSMEDLWCFNEEIVVQAIVGCPIPVITGIGHEIDVTLADFAADVRAATPSNAAELACPDRDNLRNRLPRMSALQQLLGRHIEHGRKHLTDTQRHAQHSWQLAQSRRHMHTERLTGRLVSEFQARIKQQRLALGEYIKRLTEQQPRTKFIQRERRLATAKQRLQDTIHQLIEGHRLHTQSCISVLQAETRQLPHSRSQQLAHIRADLKTGLHHSLRRKSALMDGLVARLEILNPYQVLSRGYVLSMDENRHVITSREVLATGQRLHLLYHDGEADARIEAGDSEA